MIHKRQDCSRSNARPSGVANLHTQHRHRDYVVCRDFEWIVIPKNFKLSAGEVFEVVGQNRNSSMSVFAALGDVTREIVYKLCIRRAINGCQFGIPILRR